MFMTSCQRLSCAKLSQMLPMPAMVSKVLKIVLI